MVESLVYPLIVAMLSLVVAVPLRGRTRVALERRIGFYGHEEDRNGTRADRRFLASQRIRCQARLNALDHVRGNTLALLWWLTLVGSGTSLFIGTHTVARDPSSGPGPAEFIAFSIGVAALVCAVFCTLALIDSWEVRGVVIQQTLAGESPQGVVDPMAAGRTAFWTKSQFVWTMGSLAAGPCALGVAFGIGKSNPALSAGWAGISMYAFAMIAFVLITRWRKMDTADVAGEVSDVTLERFAGLKSETYR